jgi:hypothetical protein
MHSEYIHYDFSHLDIPEGFFFAEHNVAGFVIPSYDAVNFYINYGAGYLDFYFSWDSHSHSEDYSETMPMFAVDSDGNCI